MVYWMKSRIYVYGISVVTVFGNKTEVIGKLGTAAVGPFRTRKGAVYFRTHPGIASIAEAERQACGLTPSVDCAIV